MGGRGCYFHFGPDLDHIHTAWVLFDPRTKAPIDINRNIQPKAIRNYGKGPIQIRTIAEARALKTLP